MKSFIVVFLSLALLSSAEAKEKPQIVTLSVTENGFEPNSVDVNPGVPVILKIMRKTDSTCATKIQIPSKKIKRDLPLNKEVKIEVGKLEKGEIRFGCGMGMMAGGKIFVR